MIFAVILIAVSVPFAAECADAGDVYYFGDSTTAHLAVRGCVAREHVWSGEGSTMLFTAAGYAPIVMRDGTRLTLAQAVSLYRPKYLVITLGASGGAGFLGDEDFISVYDGIIDSVRDSSPDTVIFVQSILPLSDRSVKYYKKLCRESVLHANELIRAMCDRRGIVYIDTHSLLIGSDGYLKREYQYDEYLHLTRAAYKVVTANIDAEISKYIANTEKGEDYVKGLGE